LAKSDPINELGAAVDGIRGRFLSRLGDQAAELARQLSAVKACKCEEDSLHESQAIAHKIAGLAQTLGYPKLGIMAAKVDANLRISASTVLDATEKADQIAEIGMFTELCESVSVTGKD
jgi:HPt (histidine-containing phosphotransfer) domain-containing protein